MTGRWQALVAGLVAAVVLAGCSGDENTLTQPGPSQEPGSSVPGEPFDVDDPELEAALASFYEEFLAAWDRHRTPGQGAGPAASGLAELASPAVVAEADAWRAANEALGESFERVVSQRGQHHRHRRRRGGGHLRGLQVPDECHDHRPGGHRERFPGQNGEAYYADNHYGSFMKIDPRRYP